MTLLVVMSWEGNYEIAKRHFKHWTITGWPIVGTCPEDASHPWPPDVWHARNIGKAGYNNPDLIRRWLRTVECLMEPQYNAFTDFCVIESDSVFLSPPPTHPGWLFTHLAGGKLNQGEQANAFYHTPWWFDRAAAAVIIKRGRELIAEEQWEIGSPDVFLGRIIEDTKLPWTETNTFSVNGGMMHYMLPAAIEAVKKGVWYVHGITKPE